MRVFTVVLLTAVLGATPGNGRLSELLKDFAGIRNSYIQGGLPAAYQYTETKIARDVEKLEKFILRLESLADPDVYSKTVGVHVHEIVGHLDKLAKNLGLEAVFNSARVEDEVRALIMKKGRQVVDALRYLDEQLRFRLL